MPHPREARLAYEFERISSICKPGGLIDFRCADLSDEEGDAILTDSISLDLLRRAGNSFITLDDFQRRFPNQPPEKYLISFSCKGLMKDDDGEVYYTDEHCLMVVYGWDYPPEPPTLIWLTPIWHPNIAPPHVCLRGRPFAISTTLDQICLSVGEMVQYRKYNLADPLNKEAAKWAAKYPQSFPVDKRNLLTGQEPTHPLVALVEEDNLIEWVESPSSHQENSRVPGDNLLDLL